jgi:hypothetical protein
MEAKAHFARTVGGRRHFQARARSQAPQSLRSRRGPDLASAGFKLRNAPYKIVARPFRMARLKVSQPSLARPEAPAPRRPVSQPFIRNARAQAPPALPLSLVLARPALGRSPPR